jgi:hypothetical protein
LSGHEAGQAGGALLSNVLVGQTVIGQTIPGAVSIAEVLVGSSAALTIAIKATNAIINRFLNIFEGKKKRKKKKAKKIETVQFFYVFIGYIFPDKFIVCEINMVMNTRLLSYFVLFLHKLSFKYNIKYSRISSERAFIKHYKPLWSFFSFY